MKYPFEASEKEVLTKPEAFVDAVFSSLASEFLIMPKGEGFLEYPVLHLAMRHSRVRQRVLNSLRRLASSKLHSNARFSLSY